MVIYIIFEQSLIIFFVIQSYFRGCTHEWMNVVDLLFAGSGSFKFNCGCSKTVKTSSSAS